MHTRSQSIRVFKNSLSAFSPIDTQVWVGTAGTLETNIGHAAEILCCWLYNVCFTRRSIGSKSIQSRRRWRKVRGTCYGLVWIWCELAHSLQREALAQPTWSFHGCKSADVWKETLLYKNFRDTEGIYYYDAHACYCLEINGECRWLEHNVHPNIADLQFLAIVFYW